MNPECLDLTIHSIDEIEGKLIRWRGAEYIVGEYVSGGAERICFILRNARSGLFLHLLKIWRDPSLPFFSSEVLTEDGKRSPWMHSPIAVRVEIPGAIAEMQEYLNAYSLGELHGATVSGQRLRSLPVQTDPYADVVVQSGQYLAAERWDECIEACNRILNSNPDHTEALATAALAFIRKEDYDAASRCMLRALAVEPNYFPYYRRYIRVAAAAGRFRMAMMYFLQMKEHFPHVNDIDETGASLCLECGEPEFALKFASTSDLPESEKSALEGRVRGALAAAARCKDLLARAREKIFVGTRQDLMIINDHAGALPLLREAVAAYPQNPIAQLNLAIAIHAVGESREPCDILKNIQDTVPITFIPAVQANLAFWWIEDGELTLALDVLPVLLDNLVRYNHGSVPTDPHSLPGPAVWLDHDLQLESPPERVVSLLKVCIDGSDRAKVPPEAHILLQAYSRVSVRND